jgi:diguanylate cyclase (GGDEF)-like protein
MVLGLQGATTIALGFSLLGTYRGLRSNGVDYDRFWRRSILNTSAARCFAALRSANAQDEIFLAALLQDIAILGVDRAAPDFYRDLAPNAAHRDFVEYERARVGVDHAELGAWLLDYWKLPEPLSRAVAMSHAPPIAERSSLAGVAACCVALGSECVEILLAPAGSGGFAELADHASEWLGIDAQSVAEVIGNVVAEIPEVERLFDTVLLQPDVASLILDEARDLLVLRNLRTLADDASLSETVVRFEARTAALQDAQRRDALTGLYNRGYVDLLLRREFQAATKGQWPLSVVFVDLDRFSRINASYGREVGDSVLAATAQAIASVARDSDCVARYGGKEFVIALPGLPAAGAETFCERLIARLRGTSHSIGGAAVIVTASVGLATHALDKPFERVSDLVNAANRSVYVAKKAGRDRMVRHPSSSTGALAKK